MRMVQSHLVAKEKWKNNSVLMNICYDKNNLRPLPLGEGQGGSKTLN